MYGELKDKGLEVALISFRENQGPPTVYFVDREGRLIGRGVGPRNWESRAARGFVEALLDARGP